MTEEILVLCPFGLDRGLVSKAAELSPSVPVRVLVPVGQGNAAAACGAGILHELRLSQPIGDEALFAVWVEEQILRWGSRIILAPATVAMRNLMPMLAWRLKAGLTADCTALSLDGEKLIQTRPAFGNSLMADICASSRIQMATVRPGTFRPTEKSCPEAIWIPVCYCPEAERVRLVDSVPFARGKPLPQAEIIVAGGLGIGSKENFKKLEALAAQLGAGIGASRAAVDAGFAPYRSQIGMTGVTVCPKVYIAVGISGAVQHLAGMSGADKIIAINTDPKAPIFDYADFGIVGDWETVICELIQMIQEGPL